MKKLPIFFLFFSMIVSLCANTATLTISSETTRATLKEFVKLSTRCQESARTTTDQQSFDVFKKINIFYLEHRPSLRNIDQLDDASCTILANECSQLLTEQLSAVTKVHFPTKEVPLEESLGIFTRAMPNLLSPTATPVFLKRLLLLCLLEAAIYAIENNMKKKAESAPQKSMPEIKERIKKISTLDITSQEFLALFGLGIARAVGVGVISEYSPRGLSTSYIHRFAENMMPKVIAVLTVGTLLYAKNGKLPGWFKWAAFLKLINPLILGRGFVKPSNKLYQPLLTLSYIFPFFAGSSGGLMRKNHDFSTNAWANVLVDGISGFGIFTAIPQVADQFIPTNRMALNPEHRRKTIKNCVRTAFDTMYKDWDKKAFAA
ncbi:MAG: hypothetical protein QG604_954 [Candidatus Dependentiae bacterium]|nr:hypothetical protein [Candidatus Dependentiae bacterium]